MAASDWIIYRSISIGAYKMRSKLVHIDLYLFILIYTYLYLFILIYTYLYLFILIYTNLY